MECSPQGKKRKGCNMNRFKVGGRSFIFLGIIASLIISGCATAPSTPIDPRMFRGSDWVEVSVKSIAAPDSASNGNTVFITSGMQAISDTDLEFMEVARCVENALSKKGYVRAHSTQGSDVLLRLGYGIGDPQVTSETVAISQGYSYSVGWMWFNTPAKTQTVNTKMYMRNLILEAYDLKDASRKSQLWKTTMKSEGTTPDLNRIIAYMLAASYEYFGSSTGMQIDLKINGRDPRLVEIWK
jgi:hypothetical protein